MSRRKIAGINTKGVSTIAILAAIGAALYFGYQYLNKKVTFGSPKIKFSNLSFTSVTALVTFPLNNQTDITASLDSFVGKIRYNNQDLAPVNTTEAVILPAKTVTDFTVQIPLSFLQAGSVIYQAISNGTWTTPIVLEGVATVNGVSFAVNKDLNVLPV